MDNEEITQPWRLWKRGRLEIQLLPGERSVGAWVMFNMAGFRFLLAIDVWFRSVRIGVL